MQRALDTTGGGAVNSEGEGKGRPTKFWFADSSL
jgi:hypothetical protein